MAFSLSSIKDKLTSVVNGVSYKLSQLTAGNKPQMSVALSNDKTALFVLQTTGKSVAKAQFLALPLPHEYCPAGKPDYTTILSTTLKEHIHHVNFNGTVHFQIPNDSVAVNYFTLPVLAAPKMAEALRVEHAALYANLDELHHTSKVYQSNKRTRTYATVLVRKEILRAINSGISENKLNIRSLGFEAATTMNALLSLNNKLRKRSFVFFDIKSDHTLIVFCDKDSLVGYAKLPFGYEVISNDRIVFEHTLHRHAVGELAVVNATEIAKAKKLTTSVNLNNESIDNVPDEQPQEEAQPAAAAKAPDEDDEDNQEVEIAAGHPETAAMPKEKIKTIVKKLPKWMIPEEPDSPEGYLKLNFGIFLKYMLLYTDSTRCDALCFQPEFVLVNMPESLHFLLEGISEEGQIPIQALDRHEKDSPVWENLNLYGAFCGKKYNKNFFF
ncbi:MAG: hypothetical protein IJF71_06470 [Clostridia bacterium]|nr:hypothetical protein [Clostridia bacterium]